MSASVEKDKVVTIIYKIYSLSGELLEDTTDHPLTYLHGHGELIKGVEEALEGMHVGETKEIILQPSEAFGEYSEDKLQIVPKEAFGKAEILPGMSFYTRDESGNLLPFTVLQVDENNVLIDFNHPLAGETLKFYLEVLSIRDATSEEIEHGHVHEE